MTVFCSKQMVGVGKGQKCVCVHMRQRQGLLRTESRQGGRREKLDLTVGSLAAVMRKKMVFTLSSLGRLERSRFGGEQDENQVKHEIDSDIRGEGVQQVLAHLSLRDKFKSRIVSKHMAEDTGLCEITCM